MQVFNNENQPKIASNFAIDDLTNVKIIGSYYSLDLGHLTVGFENGYVVTWVTSLNKIVSAFRAHSNQMNSFKVIEESHLLITASDMAEIKIWRIPGN